MIKTAKKQEEYVKVKRTQNSAIDTLAGILGEYVFAEYFFGDWKNNFVGDNKGKEDFENIEIKTSAYPFNEHLNLLVREDYAEKRNPPFYIQIIIDVHSKNAEDIFPNTDTYICGYATNEEDDNAPKRDFGSKFGGPGGYDCHYIPIKDLHPMENFEENYNKL